MGVIGLIILATFKPDLDPAGNIDISNRVLRLKDECKLVDGDKPGEKYILSARGGKAKDLAARSKGFEHAFVFTFATVQHRDYFPHKDPVHRELHPLIVERLQDELVIDFEDGSFS